MKNYQSFDEFKEDWNNPDYQFELSTSGSTGKPKKNLLSRTKIVISCQNTGSAIPGIQTQKSLCALPTGKMGGFMQLARALQWDTTCEVQKPSSNPMLFLSPSHDFENISLSSLQVHTILNHDDSRMKLRRFKTVLVGGGMFDAKLIQSFQDFNNTSVFVTYGMTETYSHVALQKLPSTSYQPLPGVEIKLGKRDEICIRSEITDHRWLVTNDIGEMLKNGSFKVLGRLDNVVVSGGLKFQLEDIEAIIQEHMEGPYFLSKKEDVVLGEKLVLVTPNKEINLGVINSLIDKSMGKYARIQEIIHQEVILDGVTGKVQRIINVV